jgi:hypothetical protein
MNPNPSKYRVAEVREIGGGETGHVALLPRRRSSLRAFLARRRGLHDFEVEPIMTREMLDAVVREADNELQFRALARRSPPTTRPRAAILRR